MSLATLKTKVEQLIEKAQSDGENPAIKTTNWSYFFYNGARMDLLNSIDTTGGTNFSYMFFGNKSLTDNCPPLDTSNGTNFGEMFCTSNITKVPPLDTSKGIDFHSMFHSCVNAEIPPLDTSNGTNFAGMFYLVSKPVPSIDTSNATSLNQTFRQANITEFRGNVEKCTNFREVFYDNKYITTVGEFLCIKGTDHYRLFRYCTKLTTIELLQIGENVTNTDEMFLGCTALEYIRFVPNTTRKSISFAQSSLLTAESVQSIFDGLATVTTAQTLTLNANTKILQSQVDAANAKGWTIAGGTIVSEEEYYG